MKSFNHLFEKLINHDNIFKAIVCASRGKRNRHDVRRVLDNINRYVYRLQDILTSGKLFIRKHDAEMIHDNGKDRLIVKPDFIFEQILHHALVQVLLPIFMPSMYKWSCGSLPKRGGVYGKKYLERYIKHHQNKIKYAAKGDIKQFFQSIDTDVVKRKLARKIHDEKFLNVMYIVLDSNIANYEGEDVYMGLPIGYYISQILANWLLTDFDYEIKQKHLVKCYVRYVDDFTFLGAAKRHLHRVMVAIREYLTEQLHLKIKSNYQVFKFNFIDKFGNVKGRVIDFMGFKFYRDKVLLRKHILFRAIRKARKIFAKSKLNWYESTQLLSYLGWFKHADVYGVYLKHIEPFVNIGECKKVVSLHSYKERKKKNVIYLEKYREYARAFAC